MTLELEAVDLWLSENGQAFTNENDLQEKDHLMHLVGVKIEKRIFFRLDDGKDLYCKDPSSHDIFQLKEKGESVELLEKDLHIELTEVQSRIVKELL